MSRSLSGNLLRKIVTRIFNLSSVLVLSLTSLSGAAPLIFTQKAFADSSGITINELMPNPASGSEWIEVYYSSTTGAQSLKNWYFKDAANNTSSKFDAGTTLNTAHRYATLDVNFLNNTGDTVTLYDSSNAAVATLSYSTNFTQKLGQSYGRSPDGSDTLVTFTADHVTKDAQNYVAPTLPACATATSGNFDGDTDGSVNGQSGWKSAGSYDQAVVDNTYGYDSFGCKTLRISNAVTSGSFGDQTFSYAVSPAGETSTSASNNHFEASFDIAATQSTQQPGLTLSVSPDNGSGSRMSYLRFEDQSDGIHVFFDDVTDAGPLGTTANFNESYIATLSHTATHNIKFIIDLNDGPSNDTVKVYVDGALKATGTTWEDYYRYDPEQASNSNKVPAISTLLFRAAGTAAPATQGNGYLFDNVTLATAYVSHDTTAPDVPTLVSPSNGAVINNQKGPDFNFTWNGVSDPSGVTYDWASSYSNATNNTDGGFSNVLAHHEGLTSTSLSEGNSAEGTYYWQVRACDGAGNCSNWSAPWKVTIDRTAPATFSLTGPAPVDNAFENTTAFDFTWEPSSDTNGVTYKICRSQVIPVNNVVRCDWGWTVRQSDIEKNGTQFPFNSTFDGSNGNYTWYWQVSATDAAGNTTLSNIGKVTIDTIAPTVSLSLPADGSYLQGSVNPIVGSVQDNNLLGYAVVLVSGNVNPSNVNDLETAALSGQWLSGPSFTTTGFQNQTLGNLDTAAYQDGQYTLVLVAADQAYNIGWSLNHVTVDNTAPTIPTLASPNNNSFVNTNDFYFTWNASTDASPVTYEFIASQNSHETNGVLDTGVWDNIANGNAEQNNLTTPTIHSTGAPDGTWYWQVRAIDTAGNKSGWSNVWNVTIDTKAPVVHITAPTGNLVRGIVTISGTVTDANPDHYYLVVKDSHGHVVAGPGTVYAAGVADYHWNTTKLNDGIYTIDLEARDKANNKDANSVATMQVTVDNTAPTGLANAFPADGTYTTTSALTSIDWTDATDANGPVAYYYESSHSSVTNADGSFASPVYQSAALSSSETPTLGTPEGVYYWHVRAVDAAGNSTDWTDVWEITVDNTAPTAPVASPKAGTYTSAQQVTLTSNDELSGLAGIYYTTDGSTPSKTNGTLFTAAFAVNSSETVKAIAYDNAGNASTVATFSYTINQPVTPRVLGATTDNSQGPDNSGIDGHVLGDTTTQNGNTSKPLSNDKAHSDTTKQTASVTNTAFLGLGWWWLAVLAVLFTLFMLIVAQRSGSDNKRG